MSFTNTMYDKTNTRMSVRESMAPGHYQVGGPKECNSCFQSNPSVRLQKNGTTINEAYCTQDTYYTNVSSEAIVLCDANDTLRIQVNALHTMQGDQHKQVTFQYLG